MSKINLLTSDATVEDTDKLVGTDGTTGVDAGKSKNYTVALLKAHIISGINLASDIGLNIANDYADDAAAATGGVAVGEMYLSSGVVKVRLV